MSTLILLLSILLQFAAAFLALSLIRKTKRVYAWLFLASGIFLMGVRRCVTLINVLSGGGAEIDPVAESVALMISFLMLVGVLRIGAVFEYLQRVRTKIEQELEDRKKAERERDELEQQLRQRQKLESIGTLAGGVAHEINNPLNGIMNYAQLITDRLKETSPLREFSGGIIKETERVAVIVHNLLAFARDEKQAHSPAEISDIVENTLSLMRTVMRRDQIALEVDVPDDLPRVKCRSQQIQQVFMNLLDNARYALNEKYPKYHEDKIVKVVALEFDKDGRRWVRMTVEDHGIGIPEEIEGRLFDPFFTTKPREKGTGLGLSISHGIVSDHHGELTFESEPGAFTRFYLDLPVNNGWSIEGEAESDN